MVLWHFLIYLLVICLYHPKNLPWLYLYYDFPLPQPVDPSKSSYSALKEGKRIPTLTPQGSKQISQFYQQMKNSTGKNLAALQGKALNAPSTNFCQMLQEIAEEQRFEVTYVDITELSYSGMYTKPSEHQLFIIIII